MPRPIAYTSRSGAVTYRVRIRAFGRHTTETFVTLSEAERFCQDVDTLGAETAIRERARLDPAADEYVPTMREHFESHLADLTGVDERTIKDYERLYRQFIGPVFGPRRLDTIERAEVAAWINTLAKTRTRKRDGGETDRTLSAKSIRNIVGLLSALMGSAMRTGHVKGNPAARHRLPRQAEQDRRDERFLTHDEWDAIEAALHPQHLPLFKTLVGTGLRWSEATALQVRHVNLTTKTIRVVQAWKRRDGEPGGRVIGPPKSLKSRRTVDVAPQVVELLAPLVQDQPPDAWLFRTSKGTALHHGYYRARIWVKACEAAGITDPVPRIHDLRHTHASWLLEIPGVTLEMVQDQMGHDSILTTRKIYGSLQPSMRLAMRSAVRDALAGPPKALPPGED